MNFEEIDLTSRDRIAAGVPDEELTFLRQNAPVWLHPEPNGPGCWIITKYDDVVHCSRDWETFSSEAKRGGVIGVEEPPAGRDPSDMEGEMMLTMDPPKHTRYRKLVNKGFTPRMVASLEERARAMSNAIIDRVIEKGECDFVTDLAAELPLAVIADMLGVPEADHHKIFDWSNRMIGSEDPEYMVSEGEIMNAQIEMFTYANNIAADRRENPTDDLVSKLLHGEVDGERLSEMEFDLFFLLLAVAGNETTRNALSHGALALMQHPEEREKLLKDPSLLPTAVEEVLRWASPVMFFRRNVTKDTEVRGQQMKAGDKITMWYISANRDEDVFEDPFTFDVERTPNEHLAFGGGGAHFCLGASLARLELRVMLGEVLRRMPDMALSGDVDRLRSNFINGIKHLPVTFTPAPRETPL